VTFLDGGTAIGTGTLAGGIASFTTSSLTAGTHSITAAYAGNAIFAASTSPALAQAINVPADSLKLQQLQVTVTPLVAQVSGQAITHAVDGAIADGFSDGGGSLINPSGNGMHFNFAADPDASPAGADRMAGFVGANTSGRDPMASQGNVWNGGGQAYTNDTASSRIDAASRVDAASRIDNAFAALDRGSMPTKAAPARPVEPKDWLLWADVSGLRIDNNGGTNPTLYGTRVNALLGLTRKVSPIFLVGAFGGYETFDYTSTGLNGRLKGNGWTVGSYLGWKILPGLRFDAAAAYSGIDFDGVAGTAAGTFNGNRWLLSSGLTGLYKAAGFDIEPSAKVYALWERENAYTDSLGTLQGARNFVIGRGSGGVKAAYPIAWTSSITLVPYLGLYGDYYFNADDVPAILGAVSLASTPILQGWSARATTGLGARFSNGAAVVVGGEFGGIGSDTHIWTARARASVPF
jgi:hypothetical protein